jgi:hypothetical protein
LGKHGNLKGRIECLKVVGNAAVKTVLVACFEERPSIQARRIDDLNGLASLTGSRFEQAPRRRQGALQYCNNRDLVTASDSKLGHRTVHAENADATVYPASLSDATNR